MNRLQTEFRRLYQPDHHPDQPTDATAGLIDERGRVRALVLELAAPADWVVLGALWRAVQAELDLPAPAIAASGSDALQLWFSLAEPITVEAAWGFLDALRRRHLADVADVADLAGRRVRLWPAHTTGSTAPRHTAPVPAPVGAGGNWSAFVAPDLAPLFAETPWLDLPPGDEGQAALLAPLTSIGAQAFEAARARLQPTAADTTASAAAAPAWAPAPHRSGDPDPRRFLTAVMNDTAAPLALRIEAASVLLQHPAPPADPEIPA